MAFKFNVKFSACIKLMDFSCQFIHDPILQQGQFPLFIFWRNVFFFLLNIAGYIISNGASAFYCEEKKKRKLLIFPFSMFVCCVVVSSFVLPSSPFPPHKQHAKLFRNVPFIVYDSLRNLQSRTKVCELTVVAPGNRHMLSCNVLPGPVSISFF